MEYLVHILTFLFLLFCCCNCAENTTTTDGTNEEKTSLQKGMEPVFDMTHSFLDTVFSVDFYEKSDGAFTEQDLNRIIKDKDWGALQKDWQKVFKTFGGYSACIIMGLLFVIFMPLVGLIFCCCNCCCHRCGNSKDHHDPVRAKCKRTTYTTFLLIFTTMMLAGGIITFLTSDLLHRSLKNQDNSGFVGQIQGNIDTLDTFVDKTFKEVIAEGKRLVTDGTEEILPTIRDAALTTANKVKETINATDILNRVKDLGTVAKRAYDDVVKVNSSLNKLIDLKNNVTKTLDDVKTEIQAACSGQCPTHSLTFDVNYNQLNKLQTQANSLADAQNIETSVTTAEKEFQTVSDTVNTTVQEFITKADTETSKLRVNALKEIDNLNGTADPFKNQLRNVKSDVNNAGEDIEQVGKYIWYACIGLGCVVMLVVTFYYLGVLFGLCGERPGLNAACCNRGTGANLLCTGVCCSFLFSWLLMLVVVFTFMGGSIVYSLGCKHLQPVENVEVFERMVSDSFDINISQSLNVTGLTLAGSLKACKANQGLYEALKLEALFNIDTQFNLSDVKQEVYRMTSTNNFNVGNITLLSTDLEKELNDFVNASLTTVNFTSYTSELSKPLLPDLNTTISQLRSAPPGSSDQQVQKLNDATTQLEVLRDNQLKEIESETATLKTVLANLQADANITTQVEGFKQSLTSSQNTFNSQKDNIIKQGLNESVVSIVNQIDVTVDTTKTAIKTAGKCRSLYDATQGFVNAACVSVLDPFNGLWFGLGWCLFFFIPCFIFAVLLMDLYKRKDRYVKKETFDDPNHSAYAGYDGSRGDDNIPLTRRDNARTPQSNGAQNYAYEGREHKNDPRYHRDSYERPHGSPMYAQPYAGSRGSHSYEAPPHYDDAVSQSRNYYPDSRGGYPKARYY